MVSSSLIDNKKAFLNPIACYLEYGKYNKYDDTGGRSFIKNFPEIQLPINTAEFICWNNKYDKDELQQEIADVMNYCIQMSQVLNVDIIDIINAKMDKTEKKYPVDKAKGNSKKYTEL